MEKFNTLKQIALDCGFSHVGDLDVKTIVLRKEVRAACEENKCHAYSTNWSCPPACGTLDECEERINKYHNGLILQTTGELEDNFDVEGMMETAQNHGKTFRKFSKKLKGDYPDALIITDGACTICKECTYPDKPCRFPELMTSSMEAFGMVVSDVCTANNLPYYYGPNTITYVGCVLID